VLLAIDRAKGPLPPDPKLPTPPDHPDKMCRVQYCGKNKKG